MPTLPLCGPCGPQWSISSIKHKEGSIYTVVFHGANVSQILWDVEQGCKDVESGSLVPTSSSFEINLGAVTNDGKAYFKAQCPTCEGYCNPFEFDIVHNNTQIGTPVLRAEAISETSIRVAWEYEGAAINDFELVYSTSSDFSGGISVVINKLLRSYDLVELSADTQYYFRIRARSNSQNSDWSNNTDAETNEEAVTVTPVLPAEFIFLTNTTGYFDSDDFLSKIRGLAAACTEIRWCVRWDEYETDPGVYATHKLANRMAQIDAIYASKGRPRPRYSIDFWGVRHDGKIEQFIPADDVVVFQGGKRAVGDLIVNRCYGLGSFSSQSYRNRINSCAYSIVNWFNQNAPGRLNYISLSCGQTEEFFNYLWDNPDTPENYDSHGDFSPTAVAAWRKYLSDTYGNTTPWGESSASSNIPFASWDEDGVWGVSYMIGTQKGTDWSKFTNLEMEKVVVSFRNAAKSASSNVRVIHFVADFYRAQSNGWYGNSPSNYPIISQLDGFYHSDGDMGADGDYSKKYSAFDCLVPTFGADKDYYCELDYVDMYMFRTDPGHWGEVSTTAMPDKEAIKRVCRAVYRKGGRGIHFAMSMTEPQAERAAEACIEFLEEVRSGAVTRLDRSNAPNHTFQLAPMVFGQGELLLNYYNTTAGGTETGVVNLKLINNV